MPYTDEMYGVKTWGSISDGDEAPKSKPKRKRTMKTVIKVWAVYSTNDEYGRFDEVRDLKGVYEDKKVADKASEGEGWYGGTGAVEERTAVKAAGKWWLSPMPFGVELNKKHIDPTKLLKAKALSKLTREEKAALELERE